MERPLSINSQHPTPHVPLADTDPQNTGILKSTGAAPVAAPGLQPFLGSTVPRECRKRQRDRETQAMLQKGNLAWDATGNEARVRVLGGTSTERPQESPRMGREAPGRTRCGAERRELH